MKVWIEVYERFVSAVGDGDAALVEVGRNYQSSLLAGERSLRCSRIIVSHVAKDGTKTYVIPNLPGPSMLVAVPAEGKLWIDTPC